MKILYLLSRVPYPINKGDKLRAYYQLESISKFHDVTVLALNDDKNQSINYDRLKLISSKCIVFRINKVNILFNLLNGLVNKLPFQVSYFYSKKIHKEILKEIENNKPDLIICQLIRMAEYVKDYKGIPKIIDYVDAISFGLERRLSQSNLFLKLLIKNEYCRVLLYELELSKKFDAQIIITQQDFSHINVIEKQNLFIVPNSVSDEFFVPRGIEKKFDLLFVGNMQYPPNEDAAFFLLDKILPIIRKQRENITICIAGDSPSPRLMKYNSKTVSVKGWVDNIVDIYLQSRIFIAPLRLGSGLQNKLLQALAVGLPSITSELSFQGLVNNPKDIVLVGSNPEEYARHAIQLLDDETYYSRINLTSTEFVIKNYSKEVVENQLLSVINKFNLE